MNIIVRLVAIPGLLACSAACGLAADRDPGDVYTSGPYEGKVSAQVLVPGESSAGKRIPAPAAPSSSRSAREDRGWS